MLMIYPAVTILFGLVLPMTFLLWAFTRRPRSRVHLASIGLLLVAMLTALTWSVLGFWHVLGAFWPALYGLAVLAILAVQLRRLPGAWLPRRWEAVFTGVNLLHAALWALLVYFVWQAKSYPETPVELSPPLRGGAFYVTAGGSNAWTNQHAASREGKYAMDIAKLNAWGLGAKGLFPGNLRDYSIFGADIVAPCAGEVISTENAKPNQPPLHPDGANRTGGNHVVLYCHGISVMLYHMQPGTVAVKVGDRVEAGRLLGKVGASGNAIAPHLHIGAVRGRHIPVRRDRAGPDSLQSVPLLFDGRFLVKGDTFWN